MNLHTYTRPIWLTRAATAADASEGEVTLSDAGDDYAALLAEWVAERVSDAQPLTVWTSTMKRAIQVRSRLSLLWLRADERKHLISVRPHITCLDRR